MVMAKIVLTHKDDPDDVIAKVNKAIADHGLYFRLAEPLDLDDGTQPYELREMPEGPETNIRLARLALKRSIAAATGSAESVLRAALAVLEGGRDTSADDDEVKKAIATLTKAGLIKVS